MHKLLLIVPDASLRQLYHELLVNRQIEVMPVATIEDAILLLSVYQFKMIVIYVDPLNEKSAITFITLRKKLAKWLKAKLVILTSGLDMPESNLYYDDLVLNPLHLSPVELTETIQLSLKKNFSSGKTAV